MAAEKDDRAQASQNAMLNALNRRIRYVIVIHVTPPEEDIGVIDAFFRAPLLRVVEGGSRDGEFREFLEVSGNRPLHAVGIDLGHLGIQLFVPPFVPNEHPDRHGSLLPLRLFRRYSRLSSSQ